MPGMILSWISLIIIHTCCNKMLHQLKSSLMDKMAANLADDIFNCIFLMKLFEIQLLKFVPKGPIDNKPALI